MGDFYVVDYSKVKKEGIARAGEKQTPSFSFMYPSLPHFHSGGPHLLTLPPLLPATKDVDALSLLSTT